MESYTIFSPIKSSSNRRAFAFKLFIERDVFVMMRSQMVKILKQLNTHIYIQHLYTQQKMFIHSHWTAFKKAGAYKITPQWKNALS